MLNFAAIVALVLLCFWFLVPPAPRTGVAIDTSAETASVIAALPAPSPDFNEIGTLVFYPNNEKPVPYLMYLGPDGTTAAKALVFSELPAKDYSSWSGARISVSGVVDREHVVVSRISYVSPP
jgi:hypothetical protein